MLLVIADTGPINYLQLIGHLNVLPALFERVFVPSAVRDELARPETPFSVRHWIGSPPLWIEVRDTAGLLDPLSSALGLGESAAISLAVQLRADLILMDDRRGATAARDRGLAVIGTMGLLARGAKRGLLNLSEAFDQLKRTNFRYRQETLDGCSPTLCSKA